MAEAFDRLVGAQGDVKELEYISALHQTDDCEVRTDASIKAEDIRLFLSSRYGITVSEDEVCDTILAGLSAGGTEADDEVVDLMELVAMLLIPTLLKGALTLSGEDDDDPAPLARRQDKTLPEGVVPSPPGMIGYVLKTILHDATGSHRPKELSTELIKRILVAYGECELAEDETLLQEMLNAAAGESTDTMDDSTASLTAFDASERADEDFPDAKRRTTVSFGRSKAGKGLDTSMLDANSFAEALTYDVRLYDISNEISATTNMDDVFQDDNKTTEVTYAAKARSSLLACGVASKESALKRSVTFPAIDITAETYRSKTLLVLLWATVIITYFAYFHSFSRGYGAKCEEEGMGFMYAFESPWQQNKDAMACEAGHSVMGWLGEFLNMCIVGIAYVSIGSFGNYVDCQNFLKPMFGCLFVLLMSSIPFRALRKEGTENMILYIAALLLAILTAHLHLSHALALLFSGTDEGEKSRRSSLFKVHSHLPECLQRALTNSVFAEMNVKQAAARRVALMVNNALELKSTDKDTVLNTHYGQALKNYARFGKQYARAGGFLWAWQRILGHKKLFARDGIWLPARMLAANIAQYIVVVYTLFGGMRLTKRVLDNFDKESAKEAFRDILEERTFPQAVQKDEEVADDLVGDVTSLVSDYVYTINAQGAADFTCSNPSTSIEDLLETYCFTDLNGSGDMECDANAPVNYVCPLLDPSVAETLNSTSQQALLAASGFDQDTLNAVVRDTVYQVTDESVDTLYPSEQYMVLVPMVVGLCFAVLTTAFLALIYIPTVTTTVLKLRSGYIPTLCNKDLWRYRRAPDQVTLLTGTVFWGTLVSGVVVGGTVGVVLFFFLWQGTAFYAQRLIAILIGITAVNAFRLVLVMICRCQLYKSFYREKAGIANVVVLALEWANFSLSAGFVFARMVKLLIATGMSIGRVDTPFLAPGVGRIGVIELDNCPIVHLKDILCHEAHKHPLIEQLGSIYLMKLRYATQFGKRAGTCWRLIFVYALMPWLHKYRILDRPEQLENESQHLSSDIMESFPSLNFVSLRHSIVGRNSIVGKGKTKSVRLSSAVSAANAEEEEIKEEDKVKPVAIPESHNWQMRVQELERRNRLLEMALARATFNEVEV